MQKKHFFLICAQVTWRVSEDAEDISMMTVNTIASFDQPFIRQFNLAQINGQTVNNLATMIGQPIQPELVANVTIMAISPLGFMTEDEFRAQPSQTQIEKEVREVVAEAHAEDTAPKAENS